MSTAGIAGDVNSALTRDSDGGQTLTSNFHGGSWMDVTPGDLWESTAIGGTPDRSPAPELQGGHVQQSSSSSLQQGSNQQGQDQGQPAPWAPQ